MTGRWGRRVAVTAACSIVLVACTGGDQPELEPSDLASEPTRAPRPSTTTPPQSTATELTAVEASTTTSTTSTTEPAPTTTTLEDLRAEIEADLDEAEQQIVELGAAPGSPESMEALAMFYAGDSLETVRANFQDFAALGQTLRLGEFRSTVEVLSVIEATADTATIERCRIDAALLVDADGTVVDDRVLRYIEPSTVVFEDGRWKLLGGSPGTIDEGFATCA